MRINVGTTGGVASVRPTGSAASATSTKKERASSESQDVFSVSLTARQVATLQEKMAELPTIRASKVEAIQNQIDAGNYNPDSGAVADGLLREHGHYTSHLP